MTLHNYRLVCVNALLFRDGRPCRDCVGRSPVPGIRHRCYRQSAVSSAAAAATISFNRGARHVGERRRSIHRAVERPPRDPRRGRPSRRSRHRAAARGRGCRRATTAPVEVVRRVVRGTHLRRKGPRRLARCMGASPPRGPRARRRRRRTAAARARSAEHRRRSLRRLAPTRRGASADAHRPRPRVPLGVLRGVPGVDRRGDVGRSARRGVRARRVGGDRRPVGPEWLAAPGDVQSWSSGSSASPTTVRSTTPPRRPRDTTRRGTRRARCCITRRHLSGRDRNGGASMTVTENHARTELLVTPTIASERLRALQSGRRALGMLAIVLPPCSSGTRSSTRASPTSTSRAFRSSPARS